jgi:competence protein ComEA
MIFKRLFAVFLALFAAASFAAVDVNKANAASLETVKGIGPSISASILEERKKGRFKNWDDLISRVKGVGEASAAKFSEAGLTVNGDSYKATAAAPKKDDKPKAAAAAASSVAPKKP